MKLMPTWFWYNGCKDCLQLLPLSFRSDLISLTSIWVHYASIVHCTYCKRILCRKIYSNRFVINATRLTSLLFTSTHELNVCFIWQYFPHTMSSWLRESFFLLWMANTDAWFLLISMFSIDMAIIFYEA